MPAYITLFRAALLQTILSYADAAGTMHGAKRQFELQYNGRLMRPGDNNEDTHADDAIVVPKKRNPSKRPQMEGQSLLERSKRGPAHVDARIGDTRVMQWCRLVADAPKRYQACQRLFMPALFSPLGSGVLGALTMHNADACSSMSFGGVSVQTGTVGQDVEVLSPFFSDTANAHFYADETKFLKNRSYDTGRVAHGCGVVAKEPIGDGKLIGLASVISDPDTLGIVSHDTPWLGAMINHCNRPNVMLVNGSSIGFPGQMWISALKKIEQGEELTMDYEAENVVFPQMVMKPDLSWKCASEAPGIADMASRLLSKVFR